MVDAMCTTIHGPWSACPGLHNYLENQLSTLNQTLLLAVSSSVLIAYSPTATSKGWPQGTFFKSQKAAMLGWLGLLGSLVLAYQSEGLLAGVGGLLVLTLLCTSIALGLLGSNAQVTGVIAFVIAVVWCAVSLAGLN